MTKYILSFMIVTHTALASADIFADNPTLRGRLAAVVRISDELYKEIQKNPELSKRKIESEYVEQNKQTGLFDVYFRFRSPTDRRMPPCSVKSEVGIRHEGDTAQMYVKSLVSVCAVR